MKWGEGAALAIHVPFSSCHFVPVLHLKWWQDCDLPCARGGQTGKGGVGGEEDYGIEEVSLIFILLVGAMLNGYQDRGETGGERERE